MKPNFFELAFHSIQRAVGGDGKAIGYVPLFVPGLEAAAINGDLIAAYFLAQLHEIGVGVMKSRPRAYALIRWSYDRGGTRAVEQHGDHLKQWVDDWNASLSSDERERAAGIMGQFQHLYAARR